MDLWDFKKWRRKLKYSQFEAAEALGFKRSGVQNWESERVPISEVVELACEELTLRWKQRPEFGPVTLIYADEQVWPGPDQAARRVFVQCATGEAKRQKGSMMFPTLRRTRTLTDQVIKEAVDHRQPDWKRVDAGRSSPLSGPRFGVARILVRTGSHALARRL